jgi:nicotinamidase-related amidase
MHTIELPAWAITRGRAMNCFPHIDLARTALVVVDMQNAFTLPGQVFGNPHACDIVGNVNRLADAVRAAGGPVIWTRQTIAAQPPQAYPDWQFNRADPFVRSAIDALTTGAYGHALNAQMAVAPGDLVIDKYRYSAFVEHASNLDAILKSLDIDTLIIAGTLTNCCCESTARDANMLGYKILFAADATAAVTDAEHNAALLNLCIMFADVRSTAEILELIDDCCPEPLV